MTPTFNLETKLWTDKIDIVAGMDEVGRGAFAGPVVAGCVVFDSKIQNLRSMIPIRIDDSKRLTARQREASAIWIKENALMWGIGEASVAEINKFGIIKATHKAFRRAIKDAEIRCSSSIQYLLLDAFYIPRIRKLDMNRKGSKSRKGKQLAIVKGDQKSISIAAASIIAKVYRDSLMTQLSNKQSLSIRNNPSFNKYKWDKNKGYGTKEHRDALLEYGITKHHRNQFINSFLTNNQQLKTNN